MKEGTSSFQRQGPSIERPILASVWAAPLQILGIKETKTELKESKADKMSLTIHPKGDKNVCLSLIHVTNNLQSD